MYYVQWRNLTLLPCLGMISSIKHCQLNIAVLRAEVCTQSKWRLYHLAGSPSLFPQWLRLKGESYTCSHSFTLEYQHHEVAYRSPSLRPRYAYVFCPATRMVLQQQLPKLGLDIQTLLQNHSTTAPLQLERGNAHLPWFCNWFTWFHFLWSPG